MRNYLTTCLPNRPEDNKQTPPGPVTQKRRMLRFLLRRLMSVFRVNERNILMPRIDRRDRNDRVHPVFFKAHHRRPAVSEIKWPLQLLLGDRTVLPDLHRPLARPAAFGRQQK